MKAFILLIIGSITLAGIPHGQVMKIADQKELSVSGTSTLHDWEMEAGEITGEGNFEIEGGELKDLENLTVTIPVKSLKSGKSKMDNNAYDALKADDYPEIRYALKKVSSITQNGDEYVVNATGDLTIAGTTKPISMKTTGKVASGNEVAFSGSTKFKMSEFNVEPPSVMWGTVNTGDEVTINYKVSFKQ